MDFDLTEDQKEIKNVARELLAARSPFAKVREAAESRRYDEAASSGQLDDPRVADVLADLHVRTEILRLTAYRGLSVIEQYGQPGPEGSLVKWLWSETNQLLTQLAPEIVGTEALTGGTQWAYELLRARGNSIEGGTTDILKNIIAERVLGLPKAR